MHREEITGVDPLVESLPNPDELGQEIIQGGSSLVERGAPRHAKVPNYAERTSILRRMRRVTTIAGLMVMTMVLAGSSEQSERAPEEVVASAEVGGSILSNLSPEEQEQRTIEAAAAARAREEALKEAFAEAFANSPEGEQWVIRQAVAEHRRIIEAGPGELDPTTIESKAFIGVIVDHFNPDRSLIQQDPDMIRQENAITAYFARIGQSRPVFQEESVHRTVMGDRSQEEESQNPVTNEMLSYGVVLDPRSTPQVLVFAEHDITQVISPVQWNGENYLDITMGANGVHLIGDTFDVYTPYDEPDKQLAGYVNKYTYTKIGQQIIKANENIILTPENSEQYLAAKYYCAWAGSDLLRWVDIYERTETAIVRGTVGDSGEVVLSNSNQ